MSAGHGRLAAARTGHPLHRPGRSCVHRLPAQVKILSLLGYVLAVVATPREAIWPYAAQMVLLLGVITAARVPFAAVAPRLAIGTPLVFFALTTPFIATGPRVDILGLTVSQPGLWAAWALLAKGTLGVLAALTLAATTGEHEMLDGLRRLHAPRQLVEIMGFMIRYSVVIAEQWHRMRIARDSRGFSATSPASWPALSSALGTLFIRSYERGERVHLAMLSRGYQGTPPSFDSTKATRAHWLAAAALPAGAVLVAAAAWSLG